MSIKSPVLIFISISLLVNVFAKSGNYQSEIANYKKLIEQSEISGNRPDEANYHNKLAFTHWGNGDLHSAANSFVASAKINEELKNYGALRTIYNHLGSINYEIEKFEAALGFYRKSLELNKKAGRTSEIISNQINIANTLQEIGNYSESSAYAKDAVGKALENNMMKLVAESYDILAVNAEKNGNAQEAKKYYDLYNTISKQLQKQEMDKLAQQRQQAEKQVITKQQELEVTRQTLSGVEEENREMKLQNQLLKQEQQIKDLKIAEEQARHEAQKREQRLITAVLVAIILGAFTIVILVLRQINLKKKANNQLRENNRQIAQQKEEIEQQRDLAHKQTKRITDSIQYAQRIQRAVIPPISVLEDVFDEHFIYYRPKDIVSGDFYWFTRKEHILVIAAADCTGHGVPGAFMSMLGVAYLNDIVSKIAVNKHFNSFYPDLILNELRHRIISSLHQTGDPREPKDGMDISVCIFDFEARKIRFSGANNPLIVLRNGEILQYKADKMPVSYHQKKDIPFNHTTIDLLDGDQYYMFSDGYIDQFGGEKGNKFMIKRFKQMLLNISEIPMPQQLSEIDKQMLQWKGNHTQLDDMLILGLKFRSETKEEIPQQEQKTILIAEDTDTNYILMAEVLKPLGAKLVRVKDGVEAVKYVKENPVNLVLMDINMPNMNGFDATKQIKTEKPNLPIIMQTAMSDGNEMNEASAAGANDFISKPIDLNSFMKVVVKHLN